MKRNRVLHLSLDIVASTAGRNATRKVGRVRGVAGRGLLDDDQILHGFNPDCLRILFNVPGATSSLRFPATVTRPGLVACLNCRCEPRCRTTDQPSSSSILRTSRIFTTRSISRRCVDRRPSAHAAPSLSLSHEVPLRMNCDAMLPFVAQRHDPSPLGWAQIWAHEFSDAANRSRISTFRGGPSLPWAQGVAGSNPVAPTTFLRNPHKHKEAADLRGTWLRRRSHRTADPAARLQPPGAVGGRGMNHAARRHEFSVASKPGRRFQSVSSHPRMTPFSPHSGQCHRMSDEPGRSSAMMSPSSACARDAASMGRSYEALRRASDPTPTRRSSRSRARSSAPALACPPGRPSRRPGSVAGPRPRSLLAAS